MISQSIFRSVLGPDSNSNQMTFEQFVMAYSLIMKPEGNDSADLVLKLFQIYPRFYKNGSSSSDSAIVDDGSFLA